MKILIICSYRNYAADTDYVAPFIYEQVNSLKSIGVEIEYFHIKGGLKAYLKTALKIKEIVNKYQPDLIHAHGGLCGFVATRQRTCPTVTTYHGSDINALKNRFFSKVAIKKSTYNIFVSQKLVDIAKPDKNNYQVIPCGVNTDVFFPVDKSESRRLLNLDMDKRYVLFSKAFFVKVKNYPLAKEAIKKLDNTILLELNGYTREEVNYLMNACDVALMTSFSEGSPQFIKEAMACCCPVVSTNVGDVEELISDVDNCYICDYDPEDVAFKIRKCFEIKDRNIASRQKILNGYSFQSIAKRIENIYKRLL